MLFNEKDPEEEKIKEFEISCKPLKELLDSVRDIEGFPISKDEDILAVSDAPWYTACPNPYINNFIEAFGKPYDEDTDTYEKKPFVSNVSEGKNDPIYNAHSYHTKVPHKAIMPFIEHYTEEGDIIFDGFCGTGMTGIASQLLNRKAILNDLSPVAAFISYCYNTPVNIRKLEVEAKKVLKEVEHECGWMYETLHIDGVSKGKINYIIWSDVFICPFCKNEYVFWDCAVDKEHSKIKAEYECPSCKSILTKKMCERSTVTFVDQSINKEITQTKQVPVLVNYSIGKRREEKVPDSFDLQIIENIEKSVIPYWFPTTLMLDIGEKWGDTWRSGVHLGISHVHHFYTKRNLWIVSALLYNIYKIEDYSIRNKLLFALNNVHQRHCKMNTFRFNVSFPSNITSGTLYIASLMKETNFFDQLHNKIFKRLIPIYKISSFKKENNIIGVSSATEVPVKDCSVDYIFTDPPFGDNLMYSELNYLWESWLRVLTNNKSEAIINLSQGKELNEYKELMTTSFKEMYRILKPNRWITVEFHNSKASVWNAIQDSLTKAGFIIAQVSVLDKKQGSFKQVTAAGAVKNDLIINAYKPRKVFEESFIKRAGENLEHDFIEEHLGHLPVEPNIERTEQMLYSKVLAYYVQHGYEIKLDAKNFYTLLKDNFKLIDGYWFVDSQITEYEEWKKSHGLTAIEEILTRQQTLFVCDEKSSLIWLYKFLETPKTYSDILTAYNQVITSVEDEIPEPRELLDTNFIFENGMYRRPLTDKERIEKEEKNEKELLKAFDKILLQARSSSKKIKSIRKEAVKLGFTRAYQEKRFADVLVVARKLDKDILESNSEINDFVEIAIMKVGEL